MLGYNSYDDGFSIAAKTLGWVVLLGLFFGIYLIYSGFTTMYAHDGELTGQAKKITLITPFWSSICPQYYALDVSLGILKDGTGSMSTRDIWLTVLDVKDLETMKKAVSDASIVKVHYDTRRLAACTEEYYATSFEVVK